MALLRQPVRSAADIVAHMRAFVRLLARWPQRLRMALPVEKQAKTVSQKKAARQDAYLHRFFVRKHLIALIRRSAEVYSAWLDLPLMYWREWVPDKSGALRGFPDSMTGRAVMALLGGIGSPVLPRARRGRG